MGEWWQWPAAVAGVILACGVIWRQFLHPIVKAANIVVDATPPLLALAKQAPAILATYEEFKPNGGTSLHDTIHRIDQTLDERAPKIAQIDGMDATLTGMDGRLTQHIADDIAIQEAMRDDGAKALIAAAELKIETAKIAAKLDAHATEVSDEVTARQGEILAGLARLQATVEVPNEVAPQHSATP